MTKRTINWVKTDVVTPTQLYYNVRFSMAGGVGVVYGPKNVTLDEATIVDWQHVPSSSVYVASLNDGTTWEVHKLNCNCSKRRR